MADFYIDHGAYGTGSNRIGLDAPTWGVPQEGDGYSTGAATASAVAEIQIIASPTASETLVIAGATITAGASAAANVFVRGANPAATATNIVALINSANFTNTVSTNVVTSTGIASTANQGRNLFYAQVKSGATDTVQIMWRIGSAALNHAANSNVAITSAGWASAPTITQFIGGTSGCWGWLWAPAAMGQNSSLVVNTYGFLVSRPTIVRSGAGSTIGAIAITDTVWLRTANGQTVNVTISAAVTRASTENYTLIADSNTKWTGDSGTGTFELRITNSSTFGLSYSCVGASASARIAARASAGLKLTSNNTNGSNTAIFSVSTSTSALVFDNLWFSEDATGNVGASVSGGIGNVSGSFFFTRCKFDFLKASSVGRIFQTLSTTAGYSRVWEFRDCEFNYNYTGTSNPTQALFPIAASPTGDVRARLVNCKITGLGSYYQPIFFQSSWSTTTSANQEFIAENIQGALIDVNGLAPWYDYGVVATEHLRRVFVSSAGLGASWRFENANGCADWVLGAGFPTLGGLSPGGSANSMRLFWVPGPGQNLWRGFTAPQIKQQSRGATGTKTITLEMFVPTAITLSFWNMRIMVSYVDNTGALRSRAFTGENVVSSGQSWANAGSYPGHAANKVSFTTPEQVLQYSEVAIEVSLVGTCPTGTLQYLFFDTGFTVA